MGLGSYLRFIGRFLADQPRFWKSVATDISKWIRKPSTEATAGIYGILLGILYAGATIFLAPFQFLLTTLQWGFVALVGFFLLTHGLYRRDKEAEGLNQTPNQKVKK